MVGADGAVRGDRGAVVRGYRLGFWGAEVEVLRTGRPCSRGEKGGKWGKRVIAEALVGTASCGGALNVIAEGPLQRFVWCS